MDQRCAILLTEYDFEPQQPSEFNPGAIVYPGRIFLVNWGLVVSGAGDSDTGFDQGWWLRMFTTSRDVVPSIHFYGNPGSPEFYFSAGDFAVFDLPGSFHPPLIGPSEPATES